jgi:hypothetical protein
MTTTTTGHVVGTTNATQIAAQIVLDVDSGKSITINGQTPVASFEAAPARAYANGTLSIMVAAKAKGKVREVFFKAGTVLTVVHGTSEAASTEPTPEPEAESSVAPTATTEAPSKVSIPATLKGETGWLSLRRVDGSFRYAVTMDEKVASKFAVGSTSAERHIARATAGGIKVAA